MTPRKRLSPREAKRLSTLRKRYGQKFITENARQAGKLTPTKFDSDRAREAALKRWAKWRLDKAEKLRKAQEKKLRKEDKRNESSNHPNQKIPESS